jgi:hypothetical protein
MIVMERERKLLDVISNRREAISGILMATGVVVLGTVADAAEKTKKERKKKSDKPADADKKS